MTGPLSKLEEKLGHWLPQQAEYPYLFLADRRTRRTAARMVARRVFMLPTVPVQTYLDEKGETQRAPNRRERREMTRLYRRQVGEVRSTISKRARRMELEAARVQRRYARLSERRLSELEAREEGASG